MWCEMLKRVIRCVLKQYEVLPSWIGGIDITTRELLGSIVIFTYIGVALGVWQDNLWLHPYFLNNFFFFLFSIVPIFLVSALLYYKFLVHARQKYQQHQAHRSTRSPIVRKQLEHDMVLKEMCKALGVDYDEVVNRVRRGKNGKDGLSKK